MAPTAAAGEGSYADPMKTLLKLAMAAAFAGAVVNLLLKQTARRRTDDTRAARTSGIAPFESVPVETLNDSAGTPASASAVLAGRST